jgi:hypothetical protein
VNGDVGVAGQGVEVRVGVEDPGLVPDGDGTDQAVDQLAHGRAAPATHTVQRSRHLVIDWNGGKDGCSGEEATEAVEVGIVSSAGHHLHPDRIADRAPQLSRGLDVQRFAGDEPEHEVHGFPLRPHPEALHRSLEDDIARKTGTGTSRARRKLSTS